MISVGIHIQQHGIHLAEVSQEGQLLNLHFYPLQKFTTDLSKDVAIAEFLQDIVKKYENQQVRFCFCLPQDEISYFKKLLPFKEKFKLIKTLPFDIEEESPFQPDNVFFDTKLNPTKMDDQYHILCFLTPKANVQSFTDLLNKSKIDPHLLTIEGLALTSLIEGVEPRFLGKGLKNYLYMGMDSSLLLQFVDGNLETSVSIPWASKNIVKKMQTDYKLTAQAAFKEFSEKAFVLSEAKGFTKEQIYFSSIVKTELIKFIEQFKFIQLSVETSSDHKIEDIFLFGPGSVIKNVSAFLTSQTQIMFTKLSRLENSPSLNMDKPDIQNSLVAIGNAIEGLRRPPYSGLNLIRTLKEKKLLRFQKKWKKGLIAIAASFIIFTSYAFFRDMFSKNLADEIHQIFLSYSKKIALINSSQATIPNLKNYIKQRDKESKALKFLESSLKEKSPLDHLKALTLILKVEPEWNFKITSLKIKDREINVQGQIVQQFEKTLKARLQLIAENSFVRKKSAQTKKNPYSLGEKKKANLDQQKLTEFYYSFRARKDI